MISLIIPTYNERVHIQRLLESLSGRIGADLEVIVVDGGSRDNTVKTVSLFTNVKLINAEKGRTQQMNAGSKISKGELLFFLHADSILPLDWYEAILQVFDNPLCIAGSFFLQFDQTGFWYSLYSRLSKFEGSLTTFGDQGLFVKTAVFHQMGGFRDLPIMEDYDMIRRLQKAGRVVKLNLPIITSARKFQDKVVVYQQLKNISIVLLYKVGVSPFRLAKWYGG